MAEGPDHITGRQTAPAAPRDTAGPATQVLAPLARQIALTRLAMLAEAVWPPLAAAGCIAGLYVAATLLDLWAVLPGAVHWLAGLATAAAMAGVLGIGLRDVRWPSRQQALRRMETAAQLPHRPLTSLADRPAGPARNDPATQALWRRHLERVARLAARARTAPPRSPLPQRDPFALRAGVLLLLAVALTVAGRDAPARLAGGLWSGGAAGPGATVAFDAWITPPAYTGVPPLFLNRPAAAPGTAAQRRHLPDGTPVLEVPQGSVLTARIYGGVAAAAELGGTAATLREEAGAAELTLPIAEAGRLRLKAGGRTLATAEIALIPDAPPRIAFAAGDALAVTPQLSLAVAYDVADDYGVTGASLGLALFDQPAGPPPGEGAAAQGEGPEGDPATSENAPAGLPPVLTPQTAFPLPLPGLRVREAEDETAYLNLAAHPWAGLRVEITLSAHDDAGQEGRSDTRVIRLPRREFTHPVARAVIEQRQRLATEPDAVHQVAQALGALTLHPELYYETARDYLPLRAAYWRLRNATREADLKGIYDLLWDVALHFEDGGLSLAENALRNAQDALMEALARGAGPEELERLMDELRNAMEEFLAALAQQQLQNGQTGGAAMSPDMQAIQEQDLRNMLDALEDLAQSGSRQAARELLAQMRALLEHLTTEGPGPAQLSPPQSAMNDAIAGMSELMDRQRALQDETVREDNRTGTPAQDGAGAPGEAEGRPESDADGRAGRRAGPQGGQAQLSPRQRALRDQLGRLRDQLEGAGVPAPQAMDRAERAMREAERALEGGDLESAIRRQGEALESLRDSAQALAETLLEELAMSGGQEGRDGSRGAEGRDPLGRPRPSSGPQTGEGVKVPDETELQRARRILKELQRRAGERSRPPLELDYLNRLLQRF